MTGRLDEGAGSPGDAVARKVEVRTNVQERAVELLESGNSVAAVTDYLDTYKDRQRGGKWYGAGERSTSPRER